MAIQLSEEKALAEGEIEMLNIKSSEREINSLIYELHINSKELEIHNEEKNMSVRSAEVANKQHLEGVKRIAKVEAECQRLRGLVRKKLPGRAALAQMSPSQRQNDLNISKWLESFKIRIFNSYKQTARMACGTLPLYNRQNLKQIYRNYGACQLAVISQG